MVSCHLIASPFIETILPSDKLTNPLLAMITLLAVQSSAQTFIHNVILFFDTSDNAWYNQVHWLIGTPYLSIIASKVSALDPSKFHDED